MLYILNSHVNMHVVLHFACILYGFYRRFIRELLIFNLAHLKTHKESILPAAICARIKTSYFVMQLHGQYFGSFQTNCLYYIYTNILVSIVVLKKCQILCRSNKQHFFYIYFNCHPIIHITYSFIHPHCIIFIHPFSHFTSNQVS
jgi:hypothetical protein